MRSHAGITSRPVILTAPTGVAAFNIKGCTAHTALSLPVEHARDVGVRRVQYKKLSTRELEDLRVVWAGVRYLIIDEISMVSYETLTHIHKRLGEIMEKPHLPFGGISVIAVGDFFQLPPVKAPFVFQNARERPHLWREYFRGWGLTQNERQRGDTAWATHVNALRDGQDPQAVEAAMAALRTRLCRTAGGPIDTEAAEWAEAPRLYPRTQQVQDYNDAKLRRLGASGTTIYTIRANHARILPNGQYNRDVPHELLPNNADDAGGLPEYLSLAVGARVMLRRNIMTTDGLVNGAQGTIAGFRWPGGAAAPAVPGQAPSEVLVLFDDPRVGRLYNLQQNPGGNPDQHEPVAIATVTSVFQGKRAGVVIARQQFPLVLSWALTIHKVC